MPAFEGVDGTTGYEWLNVISRLLVDDSGLQQLDALRPDFTDNPRDFPTILERAKVRVLENLLASEFTVLTRLLARIAAGHYSDPRLRHRSPAAGVAGVRHSISGLSHLCARRPALSCR